MVRMRDLIGGRSGDSEPPRRPGSTSPVAEPVRTVVAPPIPALDGTRSRVADDEPAEPLDPVRGGPRPNDDAKERFADIHSVLSAVHDAIRAGAPLPLDDLEGLVARVIQSLEHGNELFWLAHDPPVPQTDYVLAHLASVGVLALRIGADLGYDRAQLADLGLAALLFDVGFWQLPERLLGRGDSLGADEQQAYESHSRLGSEIVRRACAERAGVIEAVLQHHEREQGQGYPQGLPGSAIHPHAKVIGLADTYVRLTSPKPPQPRREPHEAIREIVRSKHDSFPSAMIKALLSEISVFPPRTLVRLNTGEVGRVIAVNRDHPLRPRIEVIADGRGDRLPTPRVVDLAQAPFLYITGPVGGGRT